MISENREEQLNYEMERLKHNLSKLRRLNESYLIVLVSSIFIIYMMEIVSTFQFNRASFIGISYWTLCLIVFSIYFYLLNIRKIQISPKNFTVIKYFLQYYLAFVLIFAALFPILINFSNPILFYALLLFSSSSFLMLESKEIVVQLLIPSLILIVGLAVQNGQDVNYLLQIVTILALGVIAYCFTRSLYNTFQNSQKLHMELKQEVEHLQDLLVLQKEANRQLQLEATLDPLTNLYNRRAYKDFLFELQENIRESSFTISVIMVDVDCFKLYNDTYGHSAGDNVLVKIGRLLHRFSAEYDCFAARWGGEEFVLILPNESEEVIERICHQIREGVYELKIPHQTSTIETVVTVSIGACTKSIADPNEIHECMSEADSALYKVKENGRNSFEYRNRIHA